MSGPLAESGPDSRRPVTTGPPRARPSRSALVYGDVNLNLIDGSAVWVQSMVLALARAGCTVTLVLKAPVQTDRLLTPLEARAGGHHPAARRGAARRRHQRPRAQPGAGVAGAERGGRGASQR